MKILLLAPDISVSKKKISSGRYGTFVDDTVPSIKKALESKGFETEVLHCSVTLLEDLKKIKKAMVFNLCDDGFRNETKTEPLVPGFLELAGFPYTGSDLETLSVCRDKRLCCDLLRANNIRAPAYWVVKSESDLKNVKTKISASNTLIVKPNFEHGSIGISQGSVAASKAQLRAQVKKLLKQFNAAVLIQQFILGREFTVAVVGEKALPVAEYVSANEYNLKDEELKWGEVSENSKGLRIIFDSASAKLKNEMVQTALKAMKLFNCRDYARFDFRVDKNGKCYLIDINPNPGLDTDCSFALITKRHGKSYPDLIHDILKSALKRYGKRIR